MNKYLLLTKHNQAKSDELKQAFDLLGIDAEERSEAYCPSCDNIRLAGVSRIPSLVAMNEDKIIHQTDNPLLFSQFDADAQAALDALDA